MKQKDPHETSPTSSHSTSQGTLQPPALECAVQDEIGDRSLHSVPYEVEANDSAVPYVRLPPKQREDRRHEFEEFVEKFKPIFEDPDDTFYEEELPPGEIDETEWWSVFEYLGVSYVCAGLRYYDDRGYYRCATRWVGDPSDYPAYHYDDADGEEWARKREEELQREELEQRGGS